ncbi:MAG: HlyD family efflux transporter periplasmic adaptor subunit [Calothrix sp. MO_167.B42]|nr:HlyD family efflux transporter periplasmic adaptor subunit [Calothrix sp. MO_167.B42]
MRNNKSHLGDNPPPTKVSMCGAIETNISTIDTKESTAISITQQQKCNHQGNCSKSLQMLLNQRPSMLVYLVFLASTSFLTALMIWVWKGKFVEVARVQGILFSPVELERYKPVKNDKLLSLDIPDKKQIKLGKLMQNRVIFKAQISQQQATFFKKGMPLKIEFDNPSLTRYGIISGKINSIFPDTDSNNKKVLFYQMEIALDRTDSMNKNQHIAFNAGQKMTTEIKGYYSIAEIFSARIN